MGTRIVSLKASNVKRLVAVEITPGDDGCVLIGGKNGAGKSSVLDSIMFALGGASMIQEQPLRRGQKSGLVKLDLGDLIVERRFTEKGSTVKVATKDGASYSSPQKVLDALFCRLSFDPLAFAQMKPAEQSATLRDLMGIDTAAIDKERADLYAERTGANRMVKEAEANLARVPAVPKLAGERPDVNKLLDEIRTASDAARAHSNAAERLKTAEWHVTRLETEMVEAETDLNRHRGRAEERIISLANRHATERANMLARHERELAELDASHKLASKESDGQYAAELVRKQDCLSDLAAAYSNAVAERDSIAAVVPTEAPDLDGLQQRLNAAKAESAQWDQLERRTALEAELEKVRAESESLTARIEQCDNRKRELLSAAEYPIDGLSVDESGSVLFEGVPFAQASRAQQIRTSVAMGLAMNPELRVLLIRDGSLLDDDGLALVAEMARERDAQIWIERVGNRDESAIIIEDGLVAEPAEKEPALSAG